MNLLYRFSKNKKIKRDFIIILFILISPFSFFLYNLVPKDTGIWNTEWFTLDPGFYDEASFYVWIIFNKILTITILTIWFITCRKWWRFVILISLFIEFYKLFICFDIAKNGIEVNALSNSLYVSIPYILLLLLTYGLNYYIDNKKTRFSVNEEINQQISRLSKFDIKRYKSIDKEFAVLIQKKHTLDKKEYLTKLIALRDRFNLE
ncbi:hypothetical protein [Winogradskyella sp. R77965]|uniref:hypothetical protein n=1 Tax=Winogradskyella sp. R77965 TaxID=3093872 RepID=UPI0037DCA947